MIKGIHHISMKCQNEEEYSQDRKWFTFVNKICKGSRDRKGSDQG